MCSILLTLSFCACESVQKKHDEATSIRKKQYVYSHMEGHILNEAYSMDLTISDTTVFGNYYRDNLEEPLDVFGSYYINDSLYLNESIANRYTNKEDEKYNYFVGKFFDGTFSGLFITPDTTIPFEFKSVKKSDIVEFDFIQTSDSVVDPISHKTIAHIDFESPMVIDTQYKYLHNTIYALMGDTNFAGDMQGFMKHKTSLNLNSIDTASLSNMKKKPDYYANFSDVTYNKNNRVIFSNSSMKFTNGMHESFQIKYCTVDLTTQKQLNLKDVLTQDEINKLPSLLEEKFRSKFKLNKTEPLEKVLYYNDNRFMNGNYFITHKGIGFLYNTHEITGFSYGPIALYVLFDEIKK